MRRAQDSDLPARHSSCVDVVVTVGDYVNESDVESSGWLGLSTCLSRNGVSDGRLSARNLLPLLPSLANTFISMVDDRGCFDIPLALTLHRLNLRLLNVWDEFLLEEGRDALLDIVGQLVGVLWRRRARRRTWCSGRCVGPVFQNMHNVLCSTVLTT